MSDWTRFDTAEGRFEYRLEWDDIGDAPWEREDGHGPVSDWRGVGYSGQPRKAPGEMILCQDRSSFRTYDFAAAVRQARADGWGYAGMPEVEPAGQRAHKAALADFERLRAWCNDDWRYVGVVVRMVDGDPDDTESLWGIESDAREYHAEVAHELAAELAARVDRAEQAKVARAAAVLTDRLDLPEEVARELAADALKAAQA